MRINSGLVVLSLTVVLSLVCCESEVKGNMINLAEMFTSCCDEPCQFSKLLDLKTRSNKTFELLHLDHVSEWRIH